MICEDYNGWFKYRIEFKFNLKKLYWNNSV